jgi:hypothetical protein
MDTLFRNTLGPGAWIVMAAIPLAIFALYFLKLKRQPLSVPSTYLWHRVIEDLHVNSFWQKLRKSLLLFLQLLIAALAILALLRPGWQGQTLEGQKFIFLIDNSASMSTTDAEGNAARLDEAKSRVASLIDQMESSMSAMIISFAQDPLVVQEFTGNRRVLREALNRIEPTAAQTDLASALRLADGFANPRRDRTEGEQTEGARPAENAVSLYIFSDGRFPPVENFSLGKLQPQFLPLGSPETQNMGITALNSRRGEENPALMQVFVQVANGSSTDATGVVELTLNNQLVDAMEVKIPGKGVSSTTFLLNDASRGILQAKLDPRGDYRDGLLVDNIAYAVLDDARSARVLLVTPGNTALEVALETGRAARFAKIEKLSPSELDSPQYKLQVENDYYQLVIYDQCAPKSMPAANTLFIGRRPPLAAWTKDAPGEPAVVPQIIDWDRSHPLLNLVELGDVQIVDSLLVKPPQGGRVLVDSSAGPLMSIAPRDQFEDVVIGFEIVGTNEEGLRTFNTRWPLEHSFPTFWLNVLEHFSQTTDEQAVHRPGDLVELRVSPGTESAEVLLPDGTKVPVEVDSLGRLAFQETDRPGIYQVYQGSNVVKSFAVNLFDRGESDVALRVRETEGDGLNIVENITIGYVEVAAQSANADIRKELWKALLVLALVVLILEWYIYNRRVYI